MSTPRIFISHSHQDNAVGLRLVNDLRARLGEDAVWYDSSGDLHGGDEWWNTIVTEITARDTFIVLLSPAALASDWVPREMGVAYYQHVKLGKRLLPLMIHPCAPATDWQLIHMLDFTDAAAYDRQFAALLADLEVAPAQQPQPIAPRDPRRQLAERLARDIHTAFGRGEWAQVLLRANVLLEETPAAMTPALWRERGLAALNLGQHDLALASLAEALKADPYDIPTLRAQANALELAGKAADAERVLERAQAYAALDDAATQLALLADLYDLAQRQQRSQDALNRATSALRLAPGNAEWQQRKKTVEDAIAQAAARAQEQRARAEQEWLAAIIPPALQRLNFAARSVNGVDMIMPPTCAVPAGPFTMGDGKVSDNKPNTVDIKQPYQIGMFPVTVAEYACAVRAKVVREPGEYGGVNWKTQLERLDHPVVCITWLDAVAYAAWLAQTTGQPWRLPTEAEWEKAARGTDGRIYPWGNQWDSSKANTSEGGPKTTTPVGAYAAKGDASPYGAHDQAGNVWEWCSTLYRDYPYNGDDGRENKGDSTNSRVLRGGSWDFTPGSARAAYRNGLRPDDFYNDRGFRLALGAAAGT